MSDEAKRYAVVEGAAVLNVIMATAEEAAEAVMPEGQSLVLATDDAVPGGTYDSGTGTFQRPA